MPLTWEERTCESCTPGSGQGRARRVSGGGRKQDYCGWKELI